MDITYENLEDACKDIGLRIKITTTRDRKKWHYRIWLCSSSKNNTAYFIESTGTSTICSLSEISPDDAVASLVKKISAKEIVVEKAGTHTENGFGYTFDVSNNTFQKRKMSHAELVKNEI